MKKIYLLTCFLVWSSMYCQNYKITYVRSSNGSIIENQIPIVVLTNASYTELTSENNSNENKIYPQEFTTIDRNTDAYKQYAVLNISKAIYMKDSLSLAKQTFEYSSETKKILGYNCKKATTVINSNTIEFWYTNELNSKGSPSILGQNLGLVLEMVRNGNYVIAATKIEKLKSLRTKQLEAKEVDGLTYKDLLWKSRFTTLSIFKDEIINFSDLSKSNDSILRFANGTIALRKIKFPKIATGSQLFADVVEQSNGDAYDRTGSLFIIPTDKEISFINGLQNGIGTLPFFTNGNGKNYQGVVATTSYDPIVELMRFFTPFGIQQYNYLELKEKKWHDKVVYRQDISDFTSLVSEKEVWVGINIGNYDKGGHKISANITIHPEEKTTIPKSIIPLFCTNNIMEMAGQEYGTMFSNDKGLEVSFTIDKPLKNCKLRYITTGHGGWENGDEFVKKTNTIFLNGKEMFSFTPWREDCGSYRLFNPASGNFQNGLSSSDYSRSNWCPGMVTYPIYIDLGDINTGSHTIQIKIPLGLPEGTSFSAWNVSGVLIGE